MEKITYRKVLGKKKFFLLWLAQAITSFGDSLSTIAFIGLIAWFAEGSKPINMMWLMLSFILPSVIFGPISGVFVDRWRRKKIMVISDIVRAFLVFLIPFTSENYQIFIIASLVSLADTFFFPARSSFIPNIVQKEELIMANSLCTSAGEFMNLIGPAVGGVIIGLFGIKVAFFIDAATFLFSAILILSISIKEGIGRKEANINSFILELKEGISFVKEKKIILFICLILGAMMIAGGAINVILPVFINEVLNKGPREFGFIMSANALGIIIGSFVAGRLAQKQDKRRIIIFAVIFCGINSSIFALNPIFTLAVTLFVVNGLANGLWEVSSQTILQEETDDEKRGRVFSVAGTIVGSTNVLSSGLAGIFGQIIGVKLLFFLCGIFISLVGIGGSFISIEKEVKE